MFEYASTIWQWLKDMGKRVKMSSLFLEGMRETSSTAATRSILYQAVASPPIKTLYNYRSVSPTSFTV
jgi:putative heme iron utilization protein